MKSVAEFYMGIGIAALKTGKRLIRESAAVNALLGGHELDSVSAARGRLMKLARPQRHAVAAQSRSLLPPAQGAAAGACAPGLQRLDQRAQTIPGWAAPPPRPFRGGGYAHQGESAGELGHCCTSPRLRTTRPDLAPPGRTRKSGG